MLMIWPDLFRIIPGATALLSRNTALRLVSSTASQFDSDASCAGPKYPTPALLTRISMGPMDRSVSCTKDTISPARLRSAEIAETLCPLLSTSLAPLCIFPRSRAHIPRLAPILAKLRAIARPIPRLAPVISATLPSRGLAVFMTHLHHAILANGYTSYHVAQNVTEGAASPEIGTCRI